MQRLLTGFPENNVRHVCKCYKMLINKKNENNSKKSENLSKKFYDFIHTHLLSVLMSGYSSDGVQQLLTTSPPKIVTSHYSHGTMKKKVNLSYLTVPSMKRSLGMWSMRSASMRAIWTLLYKVQHHFDTWHGTLADTICRRGLLHSVHAHTSEWLSCHWLCLFRREQQARQPCKEWWSREAIPTEQLWMSSRSAAAFCNSLYVRPRSHRLLCIVAVEIDMLWYRASHSPILSRNSRGVSRINSCKSSAACAFIIRGRPWRADSDGGLIHLYVS